MHFDRGHRPVGRTEPHLPGVLVSGAVPKIIIGMNDMLLIYEVTDPLGIDRELVTVPLGKDDPGAVRKLANGKIEIVVPLTTPLSQWLPTLKEELARLGFKEE